METQQETAIQAQVYIPQEILSTVERVRKLDLSACYDYHKATSHTSWYTKEPILLQQLHHVIDLLNDLGHSREASAVGDVLAICTAPKYRGGLGLSNATKISTGEEAEINFLLSAWLESLNSTDRAKSHPPPLTSRPSSRRGMSLTEKIFAVHDVERKGQVEPGQLVRVDVDWVMASEAMWPIMEQTYDELGKPEIYRNDRFWLAGDHVVDPRVNHLPAVKDLIDASERAKNVFKLTEYQGMNYTIMHTEFYRERAQPGMLVIGCDSHTCSSGALGCLSIGLGAADVAMPLVTGETWFKVPEVVNIRLVGAPAPGIGGKDVILYILKELKRNTVAAERVVEFTGPGTSHLSCDARFAIANMTTEFGGITGIFVPDQKTHDFVSKRKLARHKNSALYFLPDDDAVYAETYEIDLTKVESFVARYPNPDDVVPVSEFLGLKLDGCFIGACTTTEEDLIFAALVLQAGLKKGLVPNPTGKRKVVPGSLPILQRLKDIGIAEIYEQAGFEVGIPGCSYCVGLVADRAGEGEVWLSSQNRNFENRMGKGSIGHIASAATVAASSFDMEVKDPRDLIDLVDTEMWDKLKQQPLSPKRYASLEIHYVEPSGRQDLEPSVDSQSSAPSRPPGNLETGAQMTHVETKMLSGKVQILGNFIDTDALAPAQFLVGQPGKEEMGEHCLQYTHPEFRNRVKEGLNVVVAGEAFGVGSSREQAVLALLGCGVDCVIAKSFAFIFARNAPNLGLLAIIIKDETFYDAAKDGVEISIDLPKRAVTVGKQAVFQFELSQMEEELFALGGISSAFNQFGKNLFEVMCAPKTKEVKTSGECATGSSMQW